MIPDTLPTAFLDRALFALRGRGQMVIQLELGFDHELDAERLGRAVELVMDAEPVLGCRLDTTSPMGQWTRLDPSSRPGLVSVANEAGFEEARSAGLDPEEGPLLTATLHREHGRDRLLLRVAHEVADATALKGVARRVAELYARLADDPSFEPSPNLDGDRSIEQVTSLVPWTARPAIVGSLVRQMMLEGGSGPCQSLPLEPEETLTPTFLTRSLPATRAAALSDLVREHGATLNDLFVAAFLRALAAVSDWKAEKMLALAMSVDLRRYLPGGEAGGVCNLSAVEGISLGKRLEDDLAETVARVAAETRRRKERWIGLGIYCGGMLGMLQKMSIEKYRQAFTRQAEKMVAKGKTPPVLTNMGVVPEISFDGPPDEAWLLVPATHPPGIAFGLSGYRGALTLSTAAYPKSRPAVERLLDAVVAELP